MATPEDNGGMRASFLRVATVATWAASCACAGAAVKVTWGSPAPRLAVPAEESTEQLMRESLYKEMERHPADFIFFRTEAGAIRFMNEHSLDASRETAQRMIELGVVGYWQARTLVVLPIGSAPKQVRED